MSVEAGDTHHADAAFNTERRESDLKEEIRHGSLYGALATPGEFDYEVPHPHKTVLDLRVQERIAGRMRMGGVEEDDIQAIMAVLVLVDALRTHNKPTFICKELAFETQRALNIVDKLSVEVDMQYCQYVITDGAFCTFHRSFIATSTDVKRQLDVLDILAALVGGSTTPAEAIDYVNMPLQSSGGCCSLRDWPGKILIFPLLAFSSAGSFYGGNFYDAGAAGFIGLVIGVSYYGLVKILPSNRHLRSFSEMVTSFILGFLAIAVNELAKRSHKDIDLCFQAITLANLFFFLKGTDSALAFLEAIEGNFAAATQRLMHSLVGTLLLGLGVSLGVWAAVFGGEDRWDVLGKLSCEPRLGLGPSAALYALVLVAAQLDYKVDGPQMPAVFLSQLATLLSGPLEAYINAPAFVATLVGTTLMTLIAKLVSSTSFLPETMHLGGNKNLSRSTQRQHPDVWGMLLPSCYVLSAGSSFYRSGLTAFLQGLSSNNTLFDAGVTYMGSLFAVSVAIAVGIKGAFALISAIEGCTDAAWLSRSEETMQEQEDNNSHEGKSLVGSLVHDNLAINGFSQYLDDDENGGGAYGAYSNAANNKNNLNRGGDDLDVESQALQDAAGGYARFGGNVSGGGGGGGGASAQQQQQQRGSQRYRGLGSLPLEDHEEEGEEKRGSVPTTQRMQERQHLRSTASEGPGWFGRQLSRSTAAGSGGGGGGGGASVGGVSTRLVKHGSIGVRFVPRTGSTRGLFPRARAATET